MYRTEEVKRTAKNGVAEGTVECTLIIVKDLKELYCLMRDNRSFLEISEIRQAYKEIEAYVMMMA